MTLSERSTVGILDLLGDIGGFNGVVVGLFFVFGSFFSNMFYYANLASDIFIFKVKKDLV